MSSKLVSTGIEFPDSSTQTTAATSGAADFSALTDATVSTTDPATDTNPSATGHHWINKTSGEYFVCTDNTTDENVWVNIGEGEDDVAVIPVWYGGRALFSLGYDTSLGHLDRIDYFTIASTGNATDFGNLRTAADEYTALSDGTRGIFIRNWAIDYVTISTTGNVTDYGYNMNHAGSGMAAVSDGTRGVIAGWSYYNYISYMTIATAGSVLDFGDLTTGAGGLDGCSDETRGVFGGRYTGSGLSNVLDYVTIMSTGNAIDFGNLTSAKWVVSSCSSRSRGIFAGGTTSTSGGGYTSAIDYITIATTGNATNFGNLTVARGYIGACADGTRGVIAGGYTGSTRVNTIDYITIASTGNATDFGDLTASPSGTAGLSGD